ISPANRRKGDLVFFHSGGNVYHVGIYAGGGRIWHSPKSGAVVRLEKIWTGNVRYGRVN
ncbi:C40 family peptidase, partial [Streptomyces fulvissimus]